MLAAVDRPGWDGRVPLSPAPPGRPCFGYRQPAARTSPASAVEGSIPSRRGDGGAEGVDHARAGERSSRSRRYRLKSCDETPPDLALRNRPQFL